MKRKVGIVTYAHCENYGAELQACALSIVIGKVSHGKLKAEIIWFERTGVTIAEKSRAFIEGIVGRLKRNLIQGVIDIVCLIFKVLLHKVVKGNSDLAAKRKMRADLFEEFWAKFEPHSEKVPSNQIGFMNYDIFVAGSDQIWNWRLTGDLSPYLLIFNGDNKETRKFSYAASLGIDQIDPKYGNLYRKGFSGLDLISVRETQSAKLLAPYTDKPMEVVLDPTFLLNATDWGMCERSELHVDGDYILVYSLNSSRRFWKKIMQYANDTGLKVVNIYGSSCAPKKYDVFEVVSAGPSDFLHLIRHARIVITNSFHGTAFSINFRVPFISVLNPVSAGNSRILSITQLLNLEHRVIFDDANIRLIDIAPVDYDRAHERLDELRRASYCFLKRGLDV